MIPLLAALSALVLVSLAESLQTRRTHVAARLAFGPTGTAKGWTRSAPALRVAGLTAFAWGLATLWILHGGTVDDPASRERSEAEATRVVFVVDLSPSMFLPDAGPDGSLTRHARMGEVVEAILQRISGNLRFGVIGFYTEALPVVMEARDPELVRNVLNGLPITYAMSAGQTKLGEAVNAALDLVTDFPKDSTRLILLSDGDATKLDPIRARPESIREMLVLGLGNPLKGSYIDGHQSRQEVDTLRQVATALAGLYENVNEKHLATGSLGDLVVPLALPQRGFTLAQWAVLAMVAGAGTLALLPVALDFYGTDWKVRFPVRKARTIHGEEALEP